MRARVSGQHSELQDSQEYIERRGGGREEREEREERGKKKMGER